MAIAKTMFLAAALLIAAVHAEVKEVKATNKEIKEIEEQFDIWNNALQTLDSAQVAALYADNGVLLPTLSNEVRYTNDRVANYFDMFLLKKPYGMINESYARFLDEDKTVAANSGIYTFKLTGEDNTTSYAAGRFSYTYVKDPATGEWKIAEHHSSLLPEQTDEAYNQVYGLIRLWNQTLQTGEPSKVVDLYADESVLLPTKSNVIRDDRDGKIAYFEDFLALKPWMTIEEEHIHFLNEEKTAAKNDGIYVFRLYDAEGKESEVGARYSFVYRMDKETGEWKIETHHSSALPNDVKEEPFDKEEEAQKSSATAGRKML